MKAHLALPLLLVAGSLAIPVKRQAPAPVQCANKCSGTTSKFNYVPGKSYVYGLESETSVEFVGTSSTRTNVMQTATVTLAVQDRCNIRLWLSDAAITGAEVPDDWKSQLEAKPIYFSFDDGVIHEICPSDSEPAWVLNYKRGILSTLQNSHVSTPHTDFHEKDISGKCPTTYEVEENGEEKTYTRHKELSSCAGFHGHHSSVRTMPYEVTSRVQQNPTVQSSQHCTHKMRAHILREAICTEDHKMQKMSAPEDRGSIKTHNVQKLVFRSESGNIKSFAGSYGPSASLKFDHSEFASDDWLQARTNIDQTISRLCDLSGDDVRPETPAVFNDLVFNMRQLSATALTELFDRRTAPLCERQEKLLLDALPMCGTEACIDAMVDLMRRGSKLSSAEKYVWATSFAFVSKPTSEMVAKVEPLLDEDDARLSLGVASLVHSYCLKNPLCNEDANVMKVVNKLQSRLGQKCASQDWAQAEKMLFALKAIGNIGHVRSAVPILTRCFSEQSNLIEVRLSALTALRRMPCNSGQREPLTTLMNDRRKSVELRVGAFLQLMNCPDSQLVGDLKQVLERETVKQVGSFIWSYLKTKQASVDPLQRELRMLLKSHHLSRKFDRDPRKYSRFYEFGRFSDRLNLGAHVDAAVIFEPENFAPRNKFLNFTIHAFGQSINLFEIGGRAEGIDRVFDNLVGPEGYFTNPTKYHFNAKTPQSSPKIKSLTDLYRKRHHYRESENIDLSVYLKVFGDELLYYGINDANVIDGIKDFMNLKKMMDSLARPKDVKFSKNLVLMDTAITIPTITGWPLRISVMMTAAMQVEVKGKADFTHLLKESPKLNMDTAIKPSAAIEQTVFVAVQTANSIKTGIKVVGRMHTATAVEGQIEWEHNKQLSTKLTLPKETMEIVDLQAELFSIVGLTESRIENTDSRYAAKMCLPQTNTINRALGVKLCADAELPNNPMAGEAPLFPLTGPARCKLTLEKTDLQLTSYEFQVQFKQLGANPDWHYIHRLAFNTPGSEVNREMSADINIDPEGEVAAEIKMPFYPNQLNIDGKLETPNENTYEGRLALKVNNRDEYSMETEMQRQVLTGNKKRYTVNADIQLPDRPAIVFTHSTEYSPNSWETESKLENIYDTPMELTAKWQTPQTSSRKMVAELGYKCPHLELKLRSDHVSDAAQNMQQKVQIEYKRPSDATPHKIKIETKQTVGKEGDLLTVTRRSVFECSSHPEYNSISTFTMQKSDTLFSTELNVEAGEPKTTMILSQKTEHVGDERYEIDLRAVIPPVGLSHSADIVYQNRLPNQFLMSVDMDRDVSERSPDISGEISLTNEKPNNKWQMKAEAKVNLEGRQMRIFKEINEVNPKEFEGKTIVQWDTDKQLEIDSDLKLKSTRGTYEYEITAVGRLSGNPQTVNMHKRLKISAEETKYVSYAKIEDKSLYDFKYDMIKESPTRSNLQAHFKSNYFAPENEYDYLVTGHSETKANDIETVFRAKKNNQDWFSGEAVMPRNFSATRIQIKCRSMWDLHTEVPKELLFDYVANQPVTGPRTREITLKSQTNGMNKKWKWTLEQTDRTKLNGTYTENNQLVAEMGFGFVNKRRGASPLVRDIPYAGISDVDSPYAPLRIGEFQIDGMLKTHHPYTNRHLTATVLHHGWRNKDTDYDMRMLAEAKCHVTNKRIYSEYGVSLEEDEANANRRFGSVTFEAGVGDYQYEIHSEVDVTAGEGWIPNMQAKISDEFRWPENKKISESVELILKDESATDRFTLKYELTTPYALLSTYKHEMSVTDESPLITLRWKCDWNEGKKMHWELVRKMGATGPVEYDAKLESSFAPIRLVTGKLKCAMQPSNRASLCFRDVEAQLQWNEDNKLRFVRKRTHADGKTNVQYDIQSKIVEFMDWHMKTKYDWQYKDNAMKMNGEMELKADAEEYKLGAQIDSGTQSGVFKIQTPYETLQTGRVQVNHISDGEYEIVSERNGEALANVKGGITFRDTAASKSHRINLEVTEIQSPFEFTYDFSQTLSAGETTAVALNLEVIRDPEGTKRRTAIQTRLTKVSATHKEAMITLVTPRREMYLKTTHKEPEPTKTVCILEFQGNKASGNKPTQLIATRTKNPADTTVQIKLTDHNLREPITLTSKMEDNICANEYVDTCINHWTVVLDYTGQAPHKLTFKAMMKHEPAGADKQKHTMQLSLVHPATHLNNKLWFAHTEHRNDESSRCELGVEFKNKRDEAKRYTAALIENNNVFEELEIKGPDGYLKLRARPVTHERSGTTEYQIAAFVREGGQPEMVIAVIIEPEQNLAQLEIRDNVEQTSDVLLHASARLVNKDMVQIMVWHQKNGERIEDGDIRVELDRPDLLKTKFFVRPPIVRDYQEAISQSANRLPPARVDVEGLLPDTDALVTDMQTHTQPMIDGWGEQQAAIANELAVPVEVKEQIEAEYEMVKSLLWAITDVINESTRKITEEIIPGFDMDEAYNSATTGLADMYESAANSMPPFTEYMESVTETFNGMNEKLTSTRDWLSEQMNVDQMRDSAQETWNEFMSTSYMRQLSQWLHSASGMSWEEVKDSARQYYSAGESRVAGASATANDYWATLREYMMTSSVAQAFSSYADPAMGSFTDMDPQGKVRELASYVRDSLNSDKLLDSAKNRYMPRVTVNDRENGHFEVEFPLPVEAHSLKHLAQQMHPRHLSAVQQGLREKFQGIISPYSPMQDLDDVAQSVYDTQYSYKPKSINVVDWVPPYKTTAYLIGNQHVVTFDGKVYDFAADHSYLLARDFHREKFTISAHFASVGSRVVMDKLSTQFGENTIEIMRNGQVKVDGALVELPWQKYQEMDGSTDVKVYTYSHTIKLKTFDGIKIKCDKYYFLCSITLPGRYHGQTAGLLGSNDNEPSNDLHLPDGDENEELNAFGDSWRLEGGASANQALVERLPEAHAMHGVCADHFRSRSSPFHACFHRVNPSAYFDMCLVDMHRHVASNQVAVHREGICNISAAYLTACGKNDVPLTMPSHCIRCTKPHGTTGTFFESDSKRQSGGNLPLGSDVVFVVEESPELEFVKAKLRHLASKIVQASTFPPTKFRFGVVGFGGAGVHHRPHFHTGGSTVSFPADKLPTAANMLSFGEPVSSVTEVDPLQAVKFTLDKFPFRPMVEKVIVLIAASECDSQKVDYYEIQDETLQQDATVHVLTTKDIEMEGASNEIFIGFNGRAMLNANGVSNTEQRAKLVAPHDSCTVLAQETNGTVLRIESSTNVAVHARVIGEEVDVQRAFAQCFVCECTAHKFNPRTVCYPCDIPRPVSLIDSPAFFNIPFMKLRRTIDSAKKIMTIGDELFI